MTGDQVRAAGEQLAVLPPWLQITLSVVGFAGATWVYMSGLFKSLPQPLPRSIAAAEASKDVVVPALTIADREQIERWIDEMRKSNASDSRQTETLNRLIFTLETIDRRLEDVYHQLKRLDQSPRRDRQGRR